MGIPITPIDAASSSNPKPNIFSLPGELRNHIWRLVCLSDGPVNVEALCLPDKQKLHQPAASFTCKQFRDEVLSIYYAETQWYLGKIGYFDKGLRLHDFNLRLARWKEMLGPYTKYLTNLSMAIDGRCYGGEDFSIPADAQYEIEAVQDGKVRFERNGTSRCKCRLKPGVERQASRDGAVLLEVMKEYSASYWEPVLEGHCPKCDLSRLETLRRSEVSHLPLWEDIVSC
ncbi:hypothetical protein HII31_07796 [Pseudocercospora fuligena]|uniref:F-box domain-containing protein n=1 Tax=Pseudocercospora fuligena TaxID=685502 RepID=A0A8H6RH35_9PEZI|nr:hypothetical protein HII31_07796 [Pseudocercospora fuligena]